MKGPPTDLDSFLLANWAACSGAFWNELRKHIWLLMKSNKHLQLMWHEPSLLAWLDQNQLDTVGMKHDLLLSSIFPFANAFWRKIVSVKVEKNFSSSVRNFLQLTFNLLDSPGLSLRASRMTFPPWKAHQLTWTASCWRTEQLAVAPFETSWGNTFDYSWSPTNTYSWCDMSQAY